jgi:hypothetical protein
MFTYLIVSKGEERKTGFELHTVQGRDINYLAKAPTRSHKCDSISERLGLWLFKAHAGMIRIGTRKKAI